MTEPTDVTPDSETAPEAQPTGNEQTEASSSPDTVDAKTPEFTSLVEQRTSASLPANLDRFKDVRVDVWAELGRVEIPIGELLHIGEGSVLRLDRPIGEPVDLVSQGVRLARGEIVVVDDSFAIRIKEIDTPEE